MPENQRLFRIGGEMEKDSGACVRKNRIELKHGMHSGVAAESNTLLNRLREILSSISKDLNGLPVISVIMPAFNEEQAVGSVIRRTEEVLRMLVEKYELIVIDDGSTDKTVQHASQNGAIVISNARNLGKGCTLRRGFQQARGHIIVTMDTDGANNPEEIPKLLYPILEGNGVDVVLGSRFIGYIEDNAIPRLNILGNTIINLVLSFILGHRITDSQSGFRAYKRTVVKNLTIDSQGFEVETEMICRLFKTNLGVKEVPITCNGRNGTLSKLNPFKDGLKILTTIFRYTLAY